MELAKRLSGNYSPRLGSYVYKDKIITKTSIKEGLEMPKTINFPMDKLDEVVNRFYSLGLKVGSYKTPRGAINFIKKFAEEQGYYKVAKH